jgi:hypothetical protein
MPSAVNRTYTSGREAFRGPFSVDSIMVGASAALELKHCNKQSFCQG